MHDDLLAAARAAAQMRSATTAPTFQGEDTMSNDFDSAAWADAHYQLSRDLRRAIYKLGHAFRRLNAIQYRAPWEQERG
jgi:hypothetical protein